MACRHKQGREFNLHEPSMYADLHADPEQKSRPAQGILTTEPQTNRQTLLLSSLFTMPEQASQQASQPAATRSGFWAEIESMTSPESKDVAPEPKVGENAPTAPELVLPDGRKTLILFLRHCGCPCEFSTQTAKVILWLPDCVSAHAIVTFCILPGINHSPGSKRRRMDYSFCKSSM